eukprot:TRINITY_DN80688_c0_g1_i1.p1 TRINITY_DN80688_c0_g1~~TRINITY_DN80688_c0_g1_i1.p1  ORF type:complete len:385 (+),score=63.59 TRINITY_DN80688_c0_g1_i1:53-1156(+)
MSPAEMQHAAHGGHGEQKGHGGGHGGHDDHGHHHNPAEERIKKAGSPFAPGARIRMNSLALALMLIGPWAIFTLTASMFCFQSMYFYPTLVYIAYVGCWVIWIGCFSVAVYARMNIQEPTWYSYFAFMSFVALILGPVAGDSIFESLSEAFFRVKDLKTIHNLDVSKERGFSTLDAGIVYFDHSNSLDGMKAWHFKHHTTYCVAPIVSNRPDGPKSGSYDFWAVGKDCCSTSSADFRCGAWGQPHADGAIRALADEELPFYRLAVQQAETLYGVVAANPIFFKWSVDPETEVNSWEASAFRNFLFYSALSFSVSCLCLSIAAWKFAWLGRAPPLHGLHYHQRHYPIFQAGEPAGYRGPGWRTNYQSA